MIVNEEEALARVNSPNNLTNKLFEIKKLYADHTGRKNIPPMIQALVGTLAAVDTQKSAGEAFGLSQAMAGKYENGETKAASLVKQSIENVHSKALDSMLECLDRIKPKLESVKKATDLSSIASNLARVVEKTTPKDNSVSTNVKVIVFSPRTRSEEEYESIAV